MLTTSRSHRVGAAALFGMVQELGLFRLVSLSPLIVDTGLYSNIVMIFCTSALLLALHTVPAVPNEAVLDCRSLIKLVRE